MLWCRFQICFSIFTILVVEESSQTGLFKHLSDYVFGVHKFRKTKSIRVIFFSRCLKFDLDFKNAAKNCEKFFWFSDIFIWIGIFKLFLLRTRYFSSAASVLTSTPKISHVNKRDFFQLNWLDSDQWIWSRCYDLDFESAWERLPCCLSKVLLKWDFLDIYMSTFSESVISEIQWGSSFFFKIFQF